MQGVERQISAAHADVRAALDQGLLQTALESADHALELCQGFYGARHPATAAAVNNVAFVHKQLGNLPEAIAQYEAALKTYSALLGDGHLSTAAAALNLGLAVLANAPRQAGGLDRAASVDEARMHLERARDIRRKALGRDDHPLVLTVQLHVASAARLQRRPAEAERMLVDTIAALRKHAGDAHPAVATGLNNLGFLLKETGGSAAHARAATAYAESLRIREAALGPRHTDTIATLHNIAELRGAAGDAAGMAEAQREILRRVGHADDGVAAAGASFAAKDPLDLR